MKVFIAIALVSLAVIGVAVSTVLHTWFKYDAEHEHKWEEHDRD